MMMKKVAPGKGNIFKSLIVFLSKFSMFYDVRQTKRQALKEFKNDLKKEKTLRDELTLKVYEQLNQTDKIIIDRYAHHYREGNNAVYLSHTLNYSIDGIYKRVSSIASKLYNNVQKFNCTESDV